MDELNGIIKKQVEESGINLQLWVSQTLRKNGWDSRLDELYTDDETKITREVDIIAEKTINYPISLPKPKNVSEEEEKLVEFFGINFLDKIRIKINLVIECKYLKENDGWVFFSSKKDIIEKGLKWVLKKFPYPIFQRDLSYSMGSYWELSKKKNFRENDNVLVTETAQGIKSRNKIDIRDGLLKTIKYLVYKMKEEDYRAFSVFMPPRNGFKKLILKIITSKVLPLRIKSYFKKWILKNLGLINFKSFTFLELNIFYPVVLVDGKIYFYDLDLKKLEEKDHIIIKQNYLSKLFLKEDDVKLIGQEASKKGEVLFYVEFINKSKLENFIKNIDDEAKMIAQVAEQSFLNNFEKLALYNEIELKYGKKEADAYEFLNKILKF